MVGHGLGTPEEGHSSVVHRLCRLARYPYLNLFQSTLSPTLPYPTLPYPTLPYPTLPYPTLPYPTLHYTTLPYPTLPATLSPGRLTATFTPTLPAYPRVG